MAEDIENTIQDIQQMVASRLQSDEAKDRAFDQLYEELKQYKDDFVFQAEKPLLLDLLLFYDSMNWFQESLVKQETSPDVIADSFQYLLDEFLELLYRRDVNPMEVLESFDRTVHKAVKVEPTDNDAEDYKIKRVLKRGFSRAGRVLRAEEVIISRKTGGGGKN